MEKRKPVYKSKTLIGILVAFAGGALPIAQAEIAQMPPTDTTRWVGLVILLIGSALGTYGRMSATAEIGRPRRKKRVAGKALEKGE